MITSPPPPAATTSELPEWLTGIAVPIAAAVLAGLIVFAGLAIDARRRERHRRSTFVDELTQLLIGNANARQLYNGNEEDVMREGMKANLHRVRAAAQMKRREYRVYDFASRTAGQVLTGEEDVPQAATALAITHLLEWLNGQRKTRDFPIPPAPETVELANERG